MSNTYSPIGTPPDVIDSPFAATPVWDRPRKRRGGSRSPPARIETSDGASLAPAIGTGFGLGVGPSFPDADALTQPPQVIADTTMRRREAANRSAPKAMIAAGVIALAAAGGAGWYFTHDGGRMPATTPGTLQVAASAAPVPGRQHRPAAGYRAADRPARAWRA